MPGLLDIAPANIWQPGVIADMAGELEGDRPGYRRPWMVIAVDRPTGYALCAPMLTRGSRGLAACSPHEWHLYMPLGFTRHTLPRVVRTNEDRRRQRLWTLGRPWPDHDSWGRAWYAPLVLEHAYAVAFIDATSMLATHLAKEIWIGGVSQPFAIGRIGFEDFRRVWPNIRAHSDYIPGLPRAYWL